jgi:hypothetical protein
MSKLTFKSLMLLPPDGQARALNFVEEFKPAAFVVMGDIAFAQQLYEMSREWGMLVIFRPPGDDEAYMRADAATLVREQHELLQQHGMDQAAIYWLNEMSVDPRKPAQLQAGMEEAVRLGRRMVVGNDATGNPPTEPGESVAAKWIAMYGPQIAYANEHAHLFVFGLHEYAPAPTGPFTPFHLQRYQFFLEACDQNGWDDLEIVITEFGIGNERNEGYQCFGLSGADYAQWVIAHLPLYDHKRVLAVCVYALGGIWGWGHFDVNDAEFFAYLQQALPLEEVPMEQAWLSSVNQAVRAGPTLGLRELLQEFVPGMSEEYFAWGQTAHIQHVFIQHVQQFPVYRDPANYYVTGEDGNQYCRFALAPNGPVLYVARDVDDGRTLSSFVGPPDVGDNPSPTLLERLEAVERQHRKLVAGLAALVTLLTEEP